MPLLKSKKLIFIILLFLIASLFVYLIYAYNIVDKGVGRGQVVNLVPSGSSSSVKDGKDMASVDYEVVEIARGLYVPWSLVFPSKNRILVSERNGAIKQVVDGKLDDTPLIEFSEVASTGEAGLLGMALHPNYDSNKFVYICMTYETESGVADKIERLVDEGDRLKRDKIILDSFPAGRFHAGCRLRFGPDGKLYATAGDATTRDEAQNLDSLAGKILRMNDDGTVPEDNPFGTLVWSYGHRNPQGIAWHPSGVLYSTEHGPSGNDGPGGGDEVNVITKGSNYGWPVVSHERTEPGMENPKLVFTPAEAPASGMFYSGAVFSQFKINFSLECLGEQEFLELW